MNRANHNRLNTPIITRVIELNKYLLQISERAKNIIKRNYLDAVLKKGATLFDYAMRQLKGLDGQSYSVTGQNQGNWNSAGGILGAASFFGINAGNILGRNGWGCNNDGYGCSDNTPVNRYELIL